MPGPVVHVGAQVLCLHGGLAQPTAPMPRVMVMGQPVVTQASPYAVAGCALTGSGSPPCVSGQFVTASARVLVGGMPLLLQDSQAVCTGSGGTLSVVFAQTRVVAM